MVFNIYRLKITNINSSYIYTGVGSFAEEDVGRQGITGQSGNATASRGLEVAVANLQEYCNGI